MEINIPAPVDAEGNEINVESCEVLYDEDGRALEIEFWQWNFGGAYRSREEGGEWCFNARRADECKVRTYDPCYAYVKHPDSLQRLAEELSEAIDDRGGFWTCRYAMARGLDGTTVGSSILDISKRVIALAEKEER